METFHKAAKKMINLISCHVVTSLYAQFFWVLFRKKSERIHCREVRKFVLVILEFAYSALSVIESGSFASFSINQL